MGRTCRACARSPAISARSLKIAVGEHPNQISVHPKDDRIFVACASSDCVSVIETRRGIVTETIHTALFPRAPEGSTPDAIAIAPDGKTLFVANADNNDVAVIDIATPSRSQVKGFIPTGWYPTAVAVSPDGKQLLIGVGKGLQTKANPIPAALLGKSKSEFEAKAKAEMTKNRTDRDPRHPHVGDTLSGSLSIVPIPDEKTLAEYTETVYKNCPYSDTMLTDAPYRREYGYSLPRSATRRQSSTYFTSSRRIGPTTRSSATCLAATATRRW